MAKTYSYDFLQKTFTETLLSYGASPLIAKDVTWSMLETSLRGIDTHGIAMLPKILKRVDARRSQLKNEAEIVSQTDNLPVAVIDGHLAPGQHCCLAAARLAHEKAKQFGIGYVAVRNSTHFGASSPYLVEITNQRFIGIIGSNSLRSMAAYGLSQANLGNNPFGFATPVDGGCDFIFDSSCAVMSFGQRNVLKSRGQDTPEGAFIRAERGDEMSGVYEMADSLTELAIPFGDYKGASLAVMIEVLGGLLSSGHVGDKTETVENDEYHGQSQFAIAINPKVFDVKNFEKTAYDYVNGIRRNNKDVRLPGDNNNRTLNERRENGIPVEADLLEELKSLTVDSTVAVDWN